MEILLHRASLMRSVILAFLLPDHFYSRSFILAFLFSLPGTFYSRSFILAFYSRSGSEIKKSLDSLILDSIRMWESQTAPNV